MANDQWSPQRHLRIGFATVAFLFFGFGGWAVLTELSGAVVASGKVEVENNRQIVQHPDGGVVAEIFVTETQPIEKGDVLIRLDGALLKSEFAITEDRLFEAMARRARLEAERDETQSPVFPPELVAAAAQDPQVMELMEGQRKLFTSRRETLTKQTEQLDKRRAQIVSQIEGTDAQLASLQTQVNLITQEMDDQKALLAKGLAQSSRVSALEREAARMQGSIGELVAARAQSEGRATEVDLEVLRLAAVRREDASTQLRDIGQTELELMERRMAMRSQIDRLEIRAPVSGRVLGLQVNSPQSVLRGAEPVLYIVPQDRPLVISTRVDPINIDSIFVGQEARLFFPALPSRTTPDIIGHVTSISADAIVDQATNASYFRAEIVINPGEMKKLADQVILPGMTVDAFITTKSRSPMAYLLEPFTDYFRTALRES